VNALSPHALWVEEADSILNLGCPPGASCSNLGDAGDPFPGSSANTALGYLTRPPSASNAGAFAGVVIDSIRQVAPFGAMRFRVRQGNLTVVEASDLGATIVVDSVRTNVFRAFLDEGSSHVVSSDSVQVSADRTTHYSWLAWSDSGARTHTITGHLAGGTLTALQAIRYRVLTEHGPLGTIVTSHPPDSTGAVFLPAGTVDTLLAVPDSGDVFTGWDSDVIQSAPLLIITVTRPFTLGAIFEPRLVVTDTTMAPGVVGAQYADTLRMTGGNGYYGYTVQSGKLPPGVGLLVNGVFGGVPRKDSTYAFVVYAQSGGQSFLLPLRITVSAPVLAAADVFRELLTPNGTLTPDQLRYLDIIGNNNGRFDIGDVVAWLDKTGGAASAAMIRAILEKAQPTKP
jgi:hypothetical protein